MPSKLIALHGETKLISPRRLDTSSASPQWIMITAGTASLTTGERWHQIGLQWDETWDAQRGKGKTNNPVCRQNNINGDFGFGLCKLSWLIAFNQTCKAVADASIHACIFSLWSVFFFFFKVCLNIFILLFLCLSVCCGCSIYFPSCFSPPTVLLFFCDFF